jgi:putative endonuclease
VSYYVYLIRCGDHSLYCGITNDVAARFAAHVAGKGARYTRGRGPLELVLTRRCRDKSSALRLEYAIKQLDRRAKLALDVAQLARLSRRLARRRRGHAIAAT